MTQTVIAFVRALNECWTAGDPQDLNEFFHERMVAIGPGNRLRLEGREACVAAWTGFARGSIIHSWRESEHKVELFDATAVVTYYFDISFTSNGKQQNMWGRDMFVLVNEHGQWWVVANHYSAITD